MKIDHATIKLKAADYARMGAKLAVQAVIWYAALTVVGFFAGGIGAYWCAAHFGFNGWWASLAALFGLGVGAIGGFFTGQIVVTGIIQDMMLDAGIKTGKIGYKHAKKMLAERKALALKSPD